MNNPREKPQQGTAGMSLYIKHSSSWVVTQTSLLEQLPESTPGREGKGGLAQIHLNFGSLTTLSICLPSFPTHPEVPQALPSRMRAWEREKRPAGVQGSLLDRDPCWTGIPAQGGDGGGTDTQPEQVRAETQPRHSQGVTPVRDWCELGHFLGSSSSIAPGWRGGGT